MAAYAGAVWSYEIDTHEKLSTEAAAVSQLQKDPELLKNMGLKLTDKFKNTDGKDRNISELIGDGANFEDNLPRPLNHFYDPLHDAPLAGGHKSPDWALEDNLDIGDQWYSYKEARDYLHKALTATDEDKRKLYFGLTFQTLGHVIHHVQDMAQPQHVRNDAHCDQWYCFGSLRNYSRYEKYTDKPEIRGNLPFSGYPAVTFDQARSFWTTGTGQGLAQYTNRNFVSAGTNFKLADDGQIGTDPRYSAPRWNGTTESVPIQTLLQDDGTCPPGSTAPACQLQGDVVFYGSTVTDNYRGLTIPNPRASTASIFDQDLEHYDKKAEYRIEDTGQVIATNRLFTLNRFNFDAAHEFLIPRAVAYSAGLIDYFFRGKLGAEDVTFTDTVIALKVKNAIARSNT